MLLEEDINRLPLHWNKGFQKTPELEARSPDHGDHPIYSLV
jgi:hypothetical protein